MITGLSTDELRLIEKYREAKIRSGEMASRGKSGPETFVGRNWKFKDTSMHRPIECSISVSHLSPE